MIPIFTETNYSFEGQHAGETVHIFLNRHWIVLLGKLIGLVIFVFLPIIPVFILSGIITAHHLESLTLFLLILYYIFLWSSAFLSITMYLLDSWIVTDERVLDMTQHGFFSKTVSEMHLAKVQDISVKIEGFIPTMFGYGNVEIQSAGTVDKFIFRQVADPNAVRDKIMELANTAREKEGREI